MASETSTNPSINKSTTSSSSSSLSNPSTKWPLHLHNFKSSNPTYAFPTLDNSNKSSEALVDEALELMRDDIDFGDDAAACSSTSHKKEARRKELLLDNLDSISQAVRDYRSGNFDLDLDSDIDSDYEDDDEDDE